MQVSKTIRERISWIDICRGIAIIFVMYAHMLGSDTYRYLFYAFHMPLFFFLSGILFKDHYKSFSVMVKKSFVTIMVPYLLFALLTYVLWFIKEPQTHNTFGDFIYQIQGIVYGNGNNGYLYFNVALWFLPCLFITKIGFAVITKLLSSPKIVIPLLIVFSILGYILSTYFVFLKLPFGIETAFSAIVFFGAGFLIQKNKYIFARMTKYGLTLFIIGALCTIAFATSNYLIYGSQVDMRMNRINGYFLFYLGAFSGIMCWIACSMVIQKNSILEYIGKHTLSLFIWHTLLFALLSDFSKLLIAPKILSSITFITQILYTVISIAVILYCVRVVKRLKYAFALQIKKY